MARFEPKRAFRVFFTNTPKRKDSQSQMELIVRADSFTLGSGWISFQIGNSNVAAYRIGDVICVELIPDNHIQNPGVS